MAKSIPVHGDHQRFGSCLAVLFGGIFTLLGVAFLVFIFTMWIKEVKTRTWTKVPCVIESCEVIDHGPSHDSPFEIIVRYRYEMDGQSWESNTFALQNTRSDHYEDQSLKRRHILTSPQTHCYVNPSDPSEAILLRGSLGFTTLMLLFPLPFIFIGLVVLKAVFTKSSESVDTNSDSISESARKASKHTRKLLIGLFGVFLIAGLGFSWGFLVKPWLKSTAAQSWTETPCDIVWSQVRRHEGDSDSGPTYSVDIFYRYEFNGETYHSNSFDISRSSSSGRKKKQAIVANYPAGSRHTCYVDPDTPEIAVINRTRGPLWFGLIPLAFTAIGIGGLAHTLRSTTTNRQQSNSAQTLRQETTTGPHTLSPCSRRGTTCAIVTGIALFWNGIVAVFANEVLQGWLSGNPSWFATLFIIPFLLVGALLLCGVAYTFLALFNPKVTITLESFPALLDEPIQVSWTMAGMINRIRKLTISIEAEEAATYQQGTTTRSDTSTFYHYIIFETNSRLEMHHGSGKCTLPAHLPPSFETDNNKIVWKARVRGEIPWWPDIDDTYPIQVLASRTS